MTLARFGMTPGLLTSVGRDAEGDELIAACATRGMITDLIYRSEDLPTDRYMAVEGANGLIAAIADAHSLEAAGAKILAPLKDGRLGSDGAPYAGQVALDGNLTLDLLAEIAASPLFRSAELMIAPASPGKAERLMPFVNAGRGTLYVNLEEAGLLCQQAFETAQDAAKGLLAKGAARVLVTNGGEDAAEGRPEGILSQSPPQVLVTRVTGAGDTFMAAHIASKARGLGPEEALDAALKAAATYVSGETPL
jgi:sugar/nucleoside kinase (ribokinase family)